MSRERSQGKSGEKNNALNTVFRDCAGYEQGKMGDCSNELTQTALIFIPKLAGKCKPFAKTGSASLGVSGALTSRARSALLCSSTQMASTYAASP